MVDFDKIEVQEVTFAEQLLFTNFFDNVLKKRLEETKSSDSISYTVSKYDDDNGLEYRVYIYVCKRFSDQINFKITQDGIIVSFSTSYYLDTSLERFLTICDEIKGFMSFPQMQYVVTDLELTNRILQFFKPRTIAFREQIDNFSQEEFDKFFDKCETYGCNVILSADHIVGFRIFNLLDHTKYYVDDNHQLLRK